MVNLLPPTERLCPRWDCHRLLQLRELFSDDRWPGGGHSRRGWPVETDGDYLFEIFESNWS